MKQQIKGKRKILLIILSIILFILFVLICYSLIRKNILKNNDNEINNSITSITSEKIDYVFIDINPSLVLTVKSNKIIDIACLNEDCLIIYDSLDIKNKNLGDGIDNIYNVSKEKGFNVSNGVKVKSSLNLNLEEKDYITIEYIDNNKEQELLKNINNNDNIKTIDNNNYYNNIWEELKKDLDYDKYYTCKMKDNKLICNFIISAIESKFDIERVDILDVDSLLSNKSTVLRILKKFNFSVENDSVIINGKEYGYSISFTSNGTKYGNVLIREIIEDLSKESKDLCKYVDNEDCKIDDGFEFIRLEELNLLNPNLTKDNFIIKNYGKKDNILKMYELQYGYEIDLEKRKEEYKQEQIAAGYHLEEKKLCDEDGCMTQKMWCLPMDQEYNGMYGFCHNSEYEY